MLKFKLKLFQIRKSNLIFGLFCILLFFFFLIFINQGYYERDEFRIGADSLTYYNLAKLSPLGSFQLMTLGANYLGPVLILNIAHFDNLYVFLINLLMLFVSYALIIKNYEINRVVFISTLLLNPMVFSSIILVNKEILGLLSVVLFVRYIDSKKYIYLLFALLFAFFTRWQQALVLVAYCFIISEINLFRRNRRFSILLIILLLTVLYPILFSQVFGTVSEVNTVEKQAETAGGIITILNTMQDNYLFIFAVIPKIISNMFGNFGRIFLYITNPESIDFYDIYNSFIVLGHQYAMLLVVSLLAYQKKLKISSDLIYFSFIYLIVFSLSTMVQYRYIFPLYILFVLELSKSRQQRIENLVTASETVSRLSK